MLLLDVYYKAHFFFSDSYSQILESYMKAVMPSASLEQVIVLSSGIAAINATLLCFFHFLR